MTYTQHPSIVTKLRPLNQKCCQNPNTSVKEHQIHALLVRNPSVLPKFEESVLLSLKFIHLFRNFVLRIMVGDDQIFTSSQSVLEWIDPGVDFACVKCQELVEMSKVVLIMNHVIKHHLLMVDFDDTRATDFLVFLNWSPWTLIWQFKC